MNSIATSTGNRDARLLGLALTTALAGATLTGCATSPMGSATASVSKAEKAMAKGEHESAISFAEAAVLSAPRNAEYRATLGTAYLNAGRFGSAASAFDDAMKLGDTSPRTALSLALALSANGDTRAASNVLNKWSDDIAPADLGLAYSLAGQPGRGIDTLTIALRGGQNTAKVRQNLAYSYALAGRWREARLMAAQDVPAGQVGDRMAEWAVDAHPQAQAYRVAKLLSVPQNQADMGQPQQLALSNFPALEQMALAPLPTKDEAPLAAASQPAPQADMELPPIGDPVEPVVAAASKAEQSTNFDAAFKNTATTAQPAPSVGINSSQFAKAAAKPAAAKARAPAKAKAAPAKSVASAAPVADGTHLIQLGSFTSKKSAERAWKIYQTRYPELEGHEMVLTQAKVRGKEYWRVSAAGFTAKSSRSMCGTVKSRSSDGCFAYAEGSPLPGAINLDRRLASR